IAKLSDIKFSGNWMAACHENEDDWQLYQAVQEVGQHICPEFDIAIPVGKDSLSMRTKWEESGEQKVVKSPVSLVISAFAPVVDVRNTLTPECLQIDSQLFFVDLNPNQMRLGGSCFLQQLNQHDTEVPDCANPQII